ncbi:MAG: NUDIX hydrolase [Candidatus Saccharibacteria bacterium]|nr:MAG: NUDIX hydrolase [Candidatus Saccharibacteria bacterium]
MSKEFSTAEHQIWLSKQPKKMIVVKVIIKSKSGNVLVAKPTYKKTWQLPGGGVDEGESPEDAGVREVGEELNLTIAKQALKIIGTIHKESDDTLFLIYEYGELVAEDTSFVLPNDEIQAYKFIEPAALAERLPNYYSDFLNTYNRQ